MTESTAELLELATPYALHAISDAECASVDRLLAAAPAQVADAFRAEVRAVRETMAVVSATTAIDPPPELRTALLAAAENRQSYWRTALLASAAAIALGLGALGVGIALRPAATPTVAEQVMTAPDVRTVSGKLATGTATVVFSRDRNAGVLVMNNVPPPAPGSVYQMWLVGTRGAISAGTMDTKAVLPSTTAVLPDLGSSVALGFTVEPGSGSTQPTGAMLAQLPLG